MSQTPARIAGLEGHGGTLAVGQPANIALVDPAAVVVVDRADSASLSRNNPWHERKLTGAVVATVLRGVPTVLDGKPCVHDVVLVPGREPSELVSRLRRGWPRSRADGRAARRPKLQASARYLGTLGPRTGERVVGHGPRRAGAPARLSLSDEALDVVRIAGLVPDPGAACAAPRHGGALRGQAGLLELLMVALGARRARVGDRVPAGPDAASRRWRAGRRRERCVRTIRRWAQKDGRGVGSGADRLDTRARGGDPRPRGRAHLPRGVLRRRRARPSARRCSRPG